MYDVMYVFLHGMCVYVCNVCVYVMYLCLDACVMYARAYATLCVVCNLCYVCIHVTLCMIVVSCARNVRMLCMLWHQCVLCYERMRVCSEM